MPGLLALVNQRLQAAFDAVEPGADPVLRASDHADFQANGVLPLAKRLGLGSPRAVAEGIVDRLDVAGWCTKAEVAGPGFVNLTLDEGWLAALVAEAAADPRLGVERRAHPALVVVDYAGPNIAKEMHVGHLRSTIIGDALCRMLDFAGDRVVRENHIGDWGTPFGMLIEHLVDLGEQAGAQTLSVGELEGFYRDARAKFDADTGPGRGDGATGFAERSRARVVALQAGDPETMRLWGILVGQSLTYIDAVLARLGVLLTRDDVRGESAYNDLLDGVVEELDAKGLLVESEGALCVFPAGFTGRDGEPLPLIVRKRDGGYGYATTDLAGLRDRFVRMGASLSLYVVGAPQSQHLEMCFAAAREAGWLVPPAEARHVSFGNMLGEDRKMFRTRAGGTAKLADLLDEAEARAAAAVAAKNPDLGPEEAAEVARLVGVGAVKYADLSTDRTRDYVFDLDRMLAFDGNTAPYLQYAHARIKSIFRRADERGLGGTGPVVLGHPAERELAVALLGFDTALAATLETFSPHKLCSYLFELAGAFTGFFENCPVLRADDAGLRASRLALCDLTARVLACGLGLLGIEALERM